MRNSLANWVRHGPWVGLLSGVFLLTSASASSFQVTPMLGDVPPDQDMQAVTIRNTGDDPLTMQVDAYRWSQEDNRDHTEPADNLMIVPPITTIRPHSSQLVRFALRGASREREHAFRVHYREVPEAPREGFFGVSTVVKLDVPLFFAPANPTREIEWRVETIRPGSTIRVTAHSLGNRFARFARMAVLSPDGALLAEKGGPLYVLGGVTRSWELETDGSLSEGEVVTLQVESGGETHRHELSAR